MDANREALLIEMAALVRAYRAYHEWRFSDASSVMPDDFERALAGAGVPVDVPSPMAALHARGHELLGRFQRGSTPGLKWVALGLDADDARDLDKELSLRKGRIMPDGDSNEVGAHVGEIVRDLWEYRELTDVLRDDLNALSGEENTNDHDN